MKCRANGGINRTDEVINILKEQWSSQLDMKRICCLFFTAH